MRNRVQTKTIRLSRSIQLFSGLCAVVILILAFGSSHIENCLVHECQSVLERYGNLTEAQTQLTGIRSGVEQYLIYADPDAKERLQDGRVRLKQLLDPIGEEALADSDSRFYYRTLSVMLETFYEKVEDVASKDTVYSLYFDPVLGIKKQGEAAQNHLSELTTVFLKYKSESYNIMLNQVKNVIIWRNILAGLLAVGTIIVAYYWFRQGARESGRVLERAQLLAQGDWNLPDLALGRYVEINEIVAAFNHMKNRICEYIDGLKEKAQIEREYAHERLQALKKEQEAKDWQYRALQMQINPHFLFNTLNAISRTALLGRNEDTILLVESISNIMRYSIGNKSGVTLAEEWSVLESYVDIQRIRFRDRISFTMDIEDGVDVNSLKVPPLILQPIVENSIQHGMESLTENGAISIEARPCSIGAMVLVRDNGKGIPGDILERFGRGEYEEISRDSTGIGMRNVIQRMEYFYGRPGLVGIESSLGQGTVVTIVIPAGRRQTDEGRNRG